MMTDQEIQRAVRPDHSTTEVLIQEAQRRGIDVISFPEASAKHVGLELNDHLEHIYFSGTDRLGRVTSTIFDNKPLTTAWLRRGGFPVPEERVVDDEAGAQEALQQWGKVVIKPLGNTGGIGVTPGITSAQAIPAAVASARENTNILKETGRVLVQQHVEGRDYRILVVNQEHVYVIERIAAHVIGDGTQTVAQLVAEYNATVKEAVYIRLNAAAHELLQEQGLGLEDVPDKNQHVQLARVANYHSGGRLREAGDDLGEAAREVALAVARYFKADVVGVDVISPDLRETPGYVIELNGTPDITIHHYPHVGKSHDVARAVIDMLFPETMGDETGNQ